MFKFLRGQKGGGGQVSKTDDASSSSSNEKTTKKKKWRPLVFDQHHGGSNSNDNAQGYSYPTVYEEADEMLQLSMLIYSITDLRSLARKQQTETIEATKPTTKKKETLSTTISTPEKILDMPLSFSTCLEMLEVNRETIQQLLGDEEHENTMSSLKTIHERYQRYHHNRNNGNHSSSSKDTNDKTSNASVMIQWFNSFHIGGSGGSGSGQRNESLATNQTQQQQKQQQGDEGVEVTTTTTGTTTAAMTKAVVPRLIAYGDENSDTDMVYAVGIDPVRKRVTVAFRGSTTINDFIKDSKIVLNFQPNPILDVLMADDSSEDIHSYDDGTTTKKTKNKQKRTNYENIGIHAGFWEYLMTSREDKDNSDSKKSSSKKNEDDAKTKIKKTKFEEILDHVKSAFQQLSETGQDSNQYRLYVTGHSLGGSLATLFAFYVAAELAVASKSTTATENGASSISLVIPVPVTCVSIASPRVGEMAWRAAHTKLEEIGLLRHLRVANAQDPVTIMPKASGKFMWATLSPVSYLAFKLQDRDFSAERETFVHTGVKLRLANGKYELTYFGDVLPMVENMKKDDDDDDYTPSGTNVETFKAEGIPDVKFHGGVTYTDNLASVKPNLENISLNDVYRIQAAAVLVKKLEEGKL